MADYKALQQLLEQKEAELAQLEDALEKGQSEAKELGETVRAATPSEIKISNRQSDINFFFYIGLPAAAFTALMLYAHGTAPAEDLLIKAKSWAFGMATWAVTAASALGISITYFDIRKYQRQAQQAQAV